MISQTDFKDLFKIPHEYNVCEKTLVDFTNYVKQSHNLFKDIVGLHEQVFKLTFEEMTIEFQLSLEHANFINSRQTYFDYQGFIQGYSPNSLKLGLCYLDPKSRKASQLWELKDISDKTRVNIAKSAYKHFKECILAKILEKYLQHDIELKTWINSYGVVFHESYPIHTTGIKFKRNLGIIIPEDTFSFISHSDISQSITNENNVWTGKMLEPIKRIIESKEN